MHVLIFVCNIALAVAHQKYRYSESFVHLNVAAKYLQMTIVPGENAVKTSAHTRTYQKAVKKRGVAAVRPLGSVAHKLRQPTKTSNNKF